MSFSNQEVGSVQTACPLAQKKDVTWIELVLVGDGNVAVGGIKYRVTLPTGAIVQGFLNNEGKARIDNIPDPGLCEITFPELDREAWSQL